MDENINNFGFLTYVAEDMDNLISKINISHIQIYQSLDLLKAKQNNVSRFIVSVNNHIHEKNFFNKKNKRDVDE